MYSKIFPCLPHPQSAHLSTSTHPQAVVTDWYLYRVSVCSSVEFGIGNFYIMKFLTKYSLNFSCENKTLI